MIFCPCDQFIQVVAEWAVGAEPFLIKQSLYPTAEAYLVRVPLHPHGPTHPAVPAASEGQQQHAREAGGSNPQRPQPARFGPFLGHIGRPRPIKGIRFRRAFHNIVQQLSPSFQTRPNRDARQTLKGRGSRLFCIPPTKGGCRWAVITSVWTCTNGHCDTRLRTITLKIGQVHEPRPAMSPRTSREYDKIWDFGMHGSFSPVKRWLAAQRVTLEQ